MQCTQTREEVNSLAEARKLLNENKRIIQNYNNEMQKIRLVHEIQDKVNSNNRRTGSNELNDQDSELARSLGVTGIITNEDGTISLQIDQNSQSLKDTKRQMKNEILLKGASRETREYFDNTSYVQKQYDLMDILFKGGNNKSKSSTEFKGASTSKRANNYNSKTSSIIQSYELVKLISRV